MTAITAAANMSGAIIAALPADPDSLCVADGDPADQLHVTVLYLTDDNTELIDEARTFIAQALASIAPDGPIVANVTGVQTLGDDDPAAVVLMLDSPELQTLRDQVKTALADDINVPEDRFPEYLPHLTIGYGIDPEPLQHFVGTTVTLDRLAAMYGSDVEAVTLTAAAETGTPTWHGVIGRIGSPSGDGRIIAPVGISHRDLPLPLSWQRRSVGGHDESVVVGVMTDVQFDYMAGLVTASGTWLDAAVTPEVTECMTLVLAGVIGPSMDAGAVQYEVQELTDLVVFTAYEIAGATLVTVPAFTGVYLSTSLGGMPDDTKPEPAMLAAAAPTNPPAGWFEDPEFFAATGLTITDEGRVYGHLACWDSCHVGLPGCVTAPVSMANYAYFTTGSTRTAEGTDVPVGRLTVGTGHADPKAGFRGAAEHYDHTGATVAVVAAGEDEFGIWVSGAIVPEATAEQVEALRRSPLSGDWRTIGGNLELVGALAVNVPGFPVPRARVALAASGEQVSLIAAANIPDPDSVDVPVPVQLANGETISPEWVADTLRVRENRRRHARAALGISKIGR